MNDSPGALESLSERVDDLEKRVRALEHPTHATVGVDAHKLAPIPTPRTEQPALKAAGLLPVIGRALLGIAGAYLLRAIAESGALPKLSVSLIAVAYAFGWLVWSARVSNILKRTLYATTSALMLAPMLWENTLGFHVFSPTVTAGILAAYLTLVTVLELRTPGLRGMCIAQTIAILVTAALGFTTLQGLPFLVALLIALGISEFARSKNLPQPLWPLLAITADIAASGLIYIYAGQPETRLPYPPLSAAQLIAPAVALFAFTAASVAARVLFQSCSITIFEAIQLMISFGLMVSAVLLFAPSHGAAITGLACLALSVCSYFCALHYLADRTERRTFRIFSLWSAALVIAGSLSALPPSAAAALLSVTAIAATYFAGRLEPATLELHGTLFILSAAITAGLPSFLYACVAGAPPRFPSAAIIVVSVCALVVFVLGRPSPDNGWLRVLDLLRALVPISAVTALLIHLLLSAANSLMALGAHHIAFLRTVAICSVALAISFGAARWGRPKLTTLAWALLAGVGIKLLFEDLRHGHMGLVAASIAIFALTLMSIPRLVRTASHMH